jgi:hypothetical protein
LYESVGLTNETVRLARQRSAPPPNDEAAYTLVSSPQLAFLIDNESVFKAALCVPANATFNSTAWGNSTVPAANSSSVASSTMLNGSTATNETSLDFCLPSLMSSFETVTGQNVTVLLLAVRRLAHVLHCALASSS